MYQIHIRLFFLWLGGAAAPPLLVLKYIKKPPSQQGLALVALIRNGQANLKAPGLEITLLTKCDHALGVAPSRLGKKGAHSLGGIISV